MNQPLTEDIRNAGDQGLWKQLTAILKGPNRGWIIFISFLGMVFAVVLIWSAAALFNAEAMHDELLYIAIFLTCVMVLCAMELWYYIQAAQDTLTREAKRLEYKIEELKHWLPR